MNLLIINLPQMNLHQKQNPLQGNQKMKKNQRKNQNPEGDTKPTGPDPTLVSQVAAIVKQQIADEEEKKEDEIKLSGKKKN